MDEKRFDVVVAGLGPAGRALASRCAQAGLSVAAVDPAPHRRWPATYGSWSDELPDWLPEELVASHITDAQAWTTRNHHLARPYCILDTGGLQDTFSLNDVDVVVARVREVTHTTALLDDGRTLHARHVVDARGLAVTPDRAQQTAFGVIVDATTAAPALDGAQALFMDWRRDNGADPTEVPSFLYAVPLDPNRVLLEETCLVGKPAIPQSVLRTRLLHRLAARAVDVPADPPVERVRFTVEAPRPRGGSAVPFGARGSFTHPATGYSVATSLCAVDLFIEAVLAGKDPMRVLWPVSARTVSALRTAGLRVLLDLDPADVPEFFASFFDLPPARQHEYLAGRSDALGTARAMWALFGSVPRPLRRAILRAVL